MIERLLNLFRHNHRNIVIIPTFVPQHWNKDHDLVNSHYLYEKKEYPFCIVCGVDVP